MLPLHSSGGLRAGVVAAMALSLASGENNSDCSPGAAAAADLRRLLPSATLEDITLPANAPRGVARDIFSRYGVLVVRGLMADLAPRIRDAAENAFAQSLRLLEAGQANAVKNGDHLVGWVTPDHTLWIPAPEGHIRDRQACVLALDILSDAAMHRAASNPRTLDLLQDMMGWSNIELFGKGQCFYKEPIAGATSLGGINSTMMGPNASTDAGVGKHIRPGGNPKFLHQDSAYFTFAKEGAVATFAYAVDTDGELDNGPLYVVPGSHKLGYLEHVDTPSHLAVRGDWSFEDGLRVDGKAGDTVFFHVHTLHGSTPNRSPSPRPVFISRYLEASDYQATFATDTRMRQRAIEEHERLLALGQLPAKDRGIMLRGQREWNGPGWQIDERVYH